MRQICVFAGSSPGKRGEYRRAAKALGETLVSRGLGVVYGGAKVGLMGALADTVLDLGGHVIGVIPEPLVAREVAHDGLSELRVVKSMHERKSTMAELASGFIALPGGLGTLEETFEILTWAQLGMHAKPCGLLNVSGYFLSVIAFLDHAVDEDFLSDAHRRMLVVERDPSRLVDALDRYTPPAVEKWIDRKES